MATTAEFDTTTQAQDTIRELLAKGHSKEALNEAIRELRAKLGGLRHARHGRPADAAHIDAQLAGTLLAIAAQVGLHQRPGDFPAAWQGHHLLTTFYAAFEAAMAPNPGEGE